MALRRSIIRWPSPLLVGALLPFAAAMAQEAGPAEPPRPQLAVGSDPKYWESYFDVGERVFKQTPIAAEAAFFCEAAARVKPQVR